MAVTRLMSALLFGVGPMDAPTYAAVSVGLGAVALLATLLACAACIPGRPGGCASHGRVDSEPS